MPAKLLVHTCCGPCAIAAIENLKESHDITLFYSNSNINSPEEFNRRLESVKKIKDIYGVGLEIDEYDHRSWLNAVKGLESEQEGGQRCERCFAFSLARPSEMLKRSGYQYMATTLTTSPLKDCKLINCLGEEAVKAGDMIYLNSNFKKNNGNNLSAKLSKKYDIYRQNYCGCEFSKPLK